ncbi:MAG: hypothetical protein KAU50_01885 [Candidatus Marinimicrobia bacterium]|nr:hypothetical protein [Candidatus Neomarinimicrobiota bacterium]
MKLLTIFIICLPVLGSSQTKLGPFTFLDDSKARAYTAGVSLGGGGAVSYGGAVELKAPRLLQIFNFIPGYAFQVSAVKTDGVFIQGAFLSRARYTPKRKIIGKLGIGLGANLTSKFRFNAGLLVGVDYLVTNKYVLSAAFVGDGLLFSAGLHKGFGW